MKFIHIADLHASKSRAEPCKKVLKILIDYVKKTEEKPKVLIAGDFFDSSITAGPTYASFLNLVGELKNLTDVFFIYGTPSHEISDCLKAFSLMGCHVYERNTFEDFGNWELIALPEPRRVNFLDNIKEGADVNEHIVNEIERFTDNLPPKTKTRIVIGHGEIVGQKYDNGMLCSSPIAFRPSTLKRMNADYYAFGHIHSTMEVFENCWYSGSCYQKNFGETHNPTMIEIEIGD